MRGIVTMMMYGDTYHATDDAELDRDGILRADRMVVSHLEHWRSSYLCRRARMQINFASEADATLWLATGRRPMASVTTRAHSARRGG